MTRLRLLLTLSTLPLAMLACTRSEPRRGDAANAPVIIISIDTLRADHLPSYGAVA